ncbi:MAG: CpsD/CapB family tyrosine-protein kinase, partial [Bacteroidales bacterium]|nr:CpsD/CapB family tyrosine-protein kinase [Bacteroidales bacterium]
MDTKVHSRKDLDSLTIPFLGEIPLSYHKRRGLLSFLNKRKEIREIVVQEKSGNEINEAFRVLRTNLEFVAGKGNGSKTIMFTSANVGSGKTFTTMNLAVSFAIKGKKVMVIDLDLRKASLSTFVKSPSKGFADYLSGHVENLSQIVVSDTIHPNLDVLPVGTIPPNPTELLFSERLEQTVAELKKQYDYLFIDCPPLEIVADASIVNKLADMTVYVIRAELFDKRLLPDVEKYYQGK